MKVLPLILVLMLLFTLAIREEFKSFKLEKIGRIETFRLLSEQREIKWGEPKKESSKTPRVKPENGEGATTRELNILPLLDPDLYGQDSEKTALIFKLVEKVLTKELKDAPFYQTLLEKEPNFLSRFFETVREKFKELTFKMGKADLENLLHLKFDNPDDQFFLYLLLKDQKIPGEKVTSHYLKNKKIPLQNTFTIDKSTKPTRLFIASPPLLEALLEKKEHLDKLLTDRARIHKALKKNKEEKENLNTEWKTLLKELHLTDLPPWLNTDISSTVP